MRFLVCVVEGHGEIHALPIVTRRIVLEILGVGSQWHVREDPVRQPRSKLVDEKMVSPHRRSNRDGLERALKMAAAGKPDGILVVCDADDDCPAAWGPSVPLTVEWQSRTVPVRGVMASREYESWILSSFPRGDRKRALAIEPDQAPRDAKKALQRLIPSYTPTTHQGSQTRAMDLRAAWALSDSFDKLVRSVGALVGTDVPERPERPRH